MNEIEMSVDSDFQSKGLRAILEKKRTTQSIACQSIGEFWGAHSYGLQNSTLFQSLPPQKQQACLEDLARKRLEEAYHIEKSGMAYTAKMTLLSRTLQERELYSHFSEDEARHLSYLTRALSHISEDYKSNSFLTLLDQIIRDGERRPLIFIIQILLEGWGIEHYTNMANECQNEEFRALLQQIICDEAGHHGSGLILFSEKELTKRERNYISDVLQQFFYMIQLGPVATLESVESICDGLTQNQKKELFKQLDAQNTTAYKIETLKKLMHKSSCHELMSSLENKGYMRAFCAEEALTHIS